MTMQRPNWNPVAKVEEVLDQIAKRQPLKTKLTAVGVARDKQADHKKQE